MNYDNYWTEKTERREKNNYYEKRYNKVIDFLSPAKIGTILDLGGGNGQFMEYIDKRFFTKRLSEIWDISQSGIDIAKAKGFTAKLIDIQKPIIYNKKYSVIYLAETLEHLKNPNITLINAYNLLEEKGNLIVIQPNSKADNKHHIRQYKYKEIKNDIIKSGFNIINEKVTPAFESWSINKKDLLSFNPKLWVCFLLTLLPYSIRNLFANIYPSRFALFYIFRARKRIIK